MSESKKLVKHIPSEPPPAKPAKLKVERPCIPEDTIFKWLEIFIIPTSGSAKEISEMEVNIYWQVVLLKTILVRIAAHPEPDEFRKDCWRRLRAILEDAIEKNDPSAFEYFSKAWVKMESGSEPMRESANEASKTGETSQEAALLNLSSVFPDFKPNSPNAVLILRIIGYLQNEQMAEMKRAPTEEEIVTESEGWIDGGISAGQVRRQLKTMELLNLMSEH